MKERIIFLLLLSTLGLTAQNYSPYALLYKPSIEALKMYVDGGAYNAAFLANVQAEKPIDTLWMASDTNRLPEARGVYMLVYTAGGDLKFSLVNQKPWEVLVTHRKGKITFKVFDPEVQTFVHDVTVVESAKGNLRYSEEKDAYSFSKRFYKYGTVLVYRNGEATLAEWNGKEAYRGYSHPFWKPIFWRIQDFWWNLTSKDDGRYKQYSKYSEGMNYFATNKPKYRVGDTVMVKAYMVKKKGKPYNKDVQFAVGYYDQQKGKQVSKVLDTLAPYRAGAYTYKFVVADSLLGKKIELQLQNKKGQFLLAQEVSIEEYTLNRIAFEAELVNEQNTYYPNEPIKIKYSAIDDLGLSAMEGRIEVSVKCTSLSLPMAQPIIMLPFSLVDTTFQLDVTGRGIFTVPLNRLPPSSGVLNITIKYVAADGETEAQSFYPRWSSSPKRLHISLQNGFWVVVADSAFTPEGKTIELVKMHYSYSETYYLRDSEKSFREKIILPYTFRHGLYIDWKIEIDGELPQESIDDYGTRNNFYTWQVTPNGVKIYPEDGTMRLRYAEIYEDGKKLVFSGFLPNDTLVLPATPEFYTFSQADFDADYFGMRPDYIWVNPKLKGGADFLRLTADGPRRIYPGDTATWKLNLDTNEKPVADFDILALAYKEKQFENSGTRQSALRKSVRYPHVITGKFKPNDVSKGDAMPQPNRETLTKAWLQQLGADTLDAYKYMFAPGGVIVNQVPLPDGLTRPQFAAFVYNGGVQYAVQAFYVAGEVKHIRNITKWNYSAEVNARMADVQIRMRDKLLTVPNVRMLAGHKTELALDLANLPDSIVVQKMPSKYTSEELEHFAEHVLRFKYSPTYTLTQGAAQAFITGRDYEFAGPFAHDTIRFASDKLFLDFAFGGNAKYVLNPETRLLETEPLYDITMKMGYNYIFSYDKKQIPGEFLQLPKAAELPKTEAHQFSVVVRPASTINEGGRVEFQGIWSNENRFVFNYTHNELYAIDYNDLRYNSYWQPGQYALLIVANEYAYLVDSFNVKSQYTTYIDITEGKLISVDSALVLLKAFSDVAEQQQKMAALSYSSVEVGATTYVSGNASAIKGSVLDRATGETIPFASIVLKQDGVVVREGTTDLDGNFIINPIPPGTYMVECGFLGYFTVIVQDVILKAGEHRALQFSLSVASDMLSEVVITASEPRNQLGRTVEVITVEEIKNLPYRNIGQIAASTAGVYQLNDGDVVLNEVSIRGAREGENVMFIDGVKVRGDINLPRDAMVYDMSYLSGLPAQYGDITGGVVQFDANGDPIGGSAETLANLGSRGGNVRKNFRDYAFFIPDVTTDKNGKASFKITYPDDAANWSTYFIGMGAGKKYAYAKTNTLAYSEVSASLATPRYLLQGDSCVLIGKAMNYLDTTLRVHYRFIANGDTVLHEKGKLRDVQLHRVPVVAKDALHATYSIQLQNGFIDGEERSVPILPVGLQKSEGTFWVLDGDTSVTFTATEESLIRVGVMRTTTDFLLEEVDAQLNYYHSCNEQLASKLRAILAIQSIDAAADRRQRDSHEARKIIKQLLENRNESGLWGWWANQETNDWMTAYVLESLLQAERMGYGVNMQNTLSEVFKDLPFQNTSDRLNSLFALSTAGVETSYDYYLGKMKMDSLSVSGKLKYALIAQYIGFAYDTAAVDSVFEKDMLGNTYVPGDGTYNLAGSFHNTLLGSYWLNSQDRDEASTSCLNYMLLARRNGELNTIERAALIELLGQNLEESSAEQSTLTVLWCDGERQEIKENRGIITRKGEKVTVQKTGSGIAFASATVSRFESEPKPQSTDFVVQSTLRNADPAKTAITVGEKAVLEINIEAKAEARYVMLEIPIPASCTVVEQPFRAYRSGAYQEVKGDKVYVYLDRLAGNFTWQIQLLPRYAGDFTINPVKAELMYFPTKSGNNGVKKVEVGSGQF